MPKANLIVGLDIGTSTIKILIAERKDKEQNFEVISQTQEPSFGVRRGVVVDPEKFQESFKFFLTG